MLHTEIDEGKAEGLTSEEREELGRLQPPQRLRRDPQLTSDITKRPPAHTVKRGPPPDETPADIAFPLATINHPSRTPHGAQSQHANATRSTPRAGRGGVAATGSTRWVWVVQARVMRRLLPH